MDVLMPGMDGYSALDEIKKDVVISGIPVLMLSGIDLDMNKKLAEKLGSCGYLTKPFTRQSLLEALASCAVEGNGHNGHNEVL
jgi:CheY-like chemotaxis protein